MVLEEINSYKDSPAELIFDEFEEYAYSGHPLAHNILGNKKNVKSFTSEKLRTFMASHYTTDRMVVSIVGGVDFKRVVKLCERYFGEIETHTSANTKREKPTFRIFDTTLHRHTHQMHAMIGCEAYNLYDERKVAFTLLNNIVGGPAMNSRLNVAIREKYGFCYSVESQYTLFCDSGLFYIYAGIEPEAKERFVELAQSELKRFCTTRLSTTQLHSAKQQYIGQMTINNEQALNEMQSIGKSCLNFDHVDSIDDMRRDIESITSDDILHIANELFTEDRMSHLFYQ